MRTIRINFNIALLAFLFNINFVYASESGRNGFSGNPQSNGGAICTTCHASGSTKPTVTIKGPTIVSAGKTNYYTATVQGGPGVTGGINISTTGFAGQLAAAGTDLKLLGRELTHVSPKPMIGKVAKFGFRWTAPTSESTVNFYAAGNSTNGQDNLLGDGIGTNTFSVKVQNGSIPTPPPPLSAGTPIKLEKYVSGLNSPVVIAHAKDSRLFIVERKGKIKISKAKDNLLSTPFLDLTGKVLSRGNEQGLLGLAFHPNYASNGYFYVYYTRDVSGSSLDRSRISRFRRSRANPDLADPSSEVVIMEFTQPYANHNGGDIHFGSDGYLYIASGDGGNAGDPQNNGQSFVTLLGKMLRIDVNGVPGTTNGPDCDISGKRNYRIPPSNAFKNGKSGQGCDEIYALGVRNPWRFSFDRKNGNLWIADVGQGRNEEINFIQARASGGLNLGWRCYEGKQPYKMAGCNRNYLSPVYTYSHANGNCSITGGYVYRGTKFPALAGKYYFADFCNASIRSLTGLLSNPTVTQVLPAGNIATPSTFGEDQNGELYVANLSKGIIYRIVGANP